MNNKRPYIYFPIGFSIALIIGLFWGSQMNYTAGSAGQQQLFVKAKFNKLNEIINYIEQEYVDTVRKQELVDKTIHKLLQDLDPHSYYISADELAGLNESLEGNFDGIGVEFSIQKDTIAVIAPVTGGPSDLLGILAGDRIVEVEGKSVAGIGITNKKVMNLLRGKSGTEVSIKVLRKGAKKLIPFTITRGKIPITSVDVSYMLEEDIGYIKLSRFARSTHEEFLEAAEKLKQKGLKKMVLDLRNNGGGYLGAAIAIVDEFLSDGKLIVYTEGKSRPKKMHYATQKGSLENIEVAILIDEGSASASEIVAGAIQDNDRGSVIGRRSFGKGLVQEQSDWPDGSAVRLTIARYYTPTGRCIQKPYDDGARKYYSDYYKRLNEGELFSADSIQFPDSLKYTTPKGKTVYGGGGIMPDYFVPVDTTGFSYYLSELNYSGVFRQFSFEYADNNRKTLEAYNGVEGFNKNFSISKGLINSLVNYALEKGVKKDEEGLLISEARIKSTLKANIARYIWHNEGYYPILQEQDRMLLKAKKVLEKPTVATLEK